VDAVWASIRDEIASLKSMQTTNPACLLDKMAIRLLENFESLSNDEHVVLK
jgi:hypothetical protein